MVQTVLRVVIVSSLGILLIVHDRQLSLSSARRNGLVYFLERGIETRSFPL